MNVYALGTVIMTLIVLTGCARDGNCAWINEGDEIVEIYVSYDLTSWPIVERRDALRMKVNKCKWKNNGNVNMIIPFTDISYSDREPCGGFMAINPRIGSGDVEVGMYLYGRTGNGVLYAIKPFGPCANNRRAHDDYIIRHEHNDKESAQQVDSAEASTIAVPPSEPSGSPR